MGAFHRCRREGPARVSQHPRLGNFTRELRRRFWKLPVREEVERELPYHLEMRTREFIEQGMSETEARAEAVRRFGNPAVIAETCRNLGEARDMTMRRTEWLS